MFIKYSTGQIPLKKSRVKRKTSSKKESRRKSDDDNIISDDPDTALELGKSIRKTKAEEAEAARQVHATHARIVTESVPEPTKRRKLGKVTFDPPKKLKGVPSLTPKEQEAADIMQALKESTKTSNRQPVLEAQVMEHGTNTRVPPKECTSSLFYLKLKEPLRIAKLEKDVSDLKKIDLSAEALAALKTQVPEVKDDAKKTELPLTSSSLSVSSAIVTTLPPPSISTTPSVPQKTKTLIPTPTITTDALIITTADSEFDTLSAEALTALKTQVPSVVDNYLGSKVRDVFQKEPKNTQQILFRNILCTKGKAPSKGSKTGKSASIKERVEEPITKVVMDDAGDDVVHYDDQPQDSSKPKTLNLEWFMQPPRPPTPDPKWNKRQVALNQPEQPWFNQMVSATKDPLTFDDLMATPIDFSKYVLNRLKIDNLTQDILLGPAYNLLKGIYMLDWNNLEGDRYPFDMSKPPPLQGHPSHLTVAADYFFNYDLEYLKSSDMERTYTMSITKTKAARYEIEGIEDMVPTLWSPTKVGYDKDASKGIKHWGEGHMLLLAVQDKLFHLTDSDIVDFIVAIRMFTRSLVIKKLVEDLQLGVENRLLEASLAEDIKNLVITSCVEIRNKDLHDEIERISKESKDVSNESKTADTAKSIAFEIALQHKSRENNSLKIVQKENENFMASLQLENAHLKQTYKDLFESVQRSKVETNQCDEVKVKDNFDEIETKNIELEYRVASLIKENDTREVDLQKLV
ncbi:hypothetical protein Tco_0702981 [Tanacetum coccineum]|uniref:Uncharacterized protein n=1 Tax=Tanacetum coccineum TaxID=301880 RepID=A0ABQ4XXK2_9ASTR